MAAFTPCNVENDHATAVPHHGFEGKLPAATSGVVQTPWDGPVLTHWGRMTQGLLRGPALRWRL